LDNLISNVYNISRERSKLLIDRGKVKLNFQPIDKVIQELGASDLVSVRGYGRFKLKALSGFSKKGRIKVVVDVIEKR
jgi:RNA-binding protein YlmH